MDNAALKGIAAEETRYMVRRELRSPPSAAIAGILFSLLSTASMALISSVDSPSDFSADWLETWFNTTALAVGLLSFAGIAFLWFTGVIRDLVGDREDKLFSTVFLGSGIIFVVTMFVWAASFGAIFRIYSAATDSLLADNDVFVFGIALMDEILGNYALRVAGIYMASIGSLWMRTRTAPRWLVIVTYIVALGFLFLANTIREAQFVFPAWVFVVSIYILAMNYRRSHDQEGEDERALELGS
jgi:hypothetical protein